MLNQANLKRSNGIAWRRLPGVRGFLNLRWDNTLFFFISLLLALSFVLLYSASSQKITTLSRHGLHVGISVGVFFLMAQIPVRTLKFCTPILYGLGIILLLGVLLLGSSSKGAQRWIHVLGSFRFQPSELMKLLVPLMLAFYLREKPPILTKMRLLGGLLLTFIPGLMIIKQPDLGTGLLVIATGFGVLFFGGIRWRWLAQLFILTICTIPVLWWKLHDYQRQRVLTFLSPERDPLGSGYHIIQSKIAIGSGGLFGKGWCLGSQAQLNFLPERTTDFIFSVLAEEFGFTGACLLCLLYFAILIKGLLIMVNAQDNFSRLVAGGISFGFFMCLFINIGMVSGVLPVVGCPLPLISYGGTSLIVWMAAFGLLAGIHSQSKRASKKHERI